MSVLYLPLREEILFPPELGYNPARTARKHVPAVIHELARRPDRAGTINLDLGGGPYTLGTELLGLVGITNVIVDPYARTRRCNLDALNFLAANRPGGVDSVTLGSVLNVLLDMPSRERLVGLAAGVLRPGGLLLVSVYEGDRGGHGRLTRDGYQANLPAAAYLDVLEAAFPGICRPGRRNVFVAYRCGKLPLDNQPLPA